MKHRKINRLLQIGIIVGLILPSILVIPSSTVAKSPEEPKPYNPDPLMYGDDVVSLPIPPLADGDEPLL